MPFAVPCNNHNDLLQRTISGFQLVPVKPIFSVYVRCNLPAYISTRRQSANPFLSEVMFLNDFTQLPESDHCSVSLLYIYFMYNSILMCIYMVSVAVVCVCIYIYIHAYEYIYFILINTYGYICMDICYLNISLK